MIQFDDDKQKQTTDALHKKEEEEVVQIIASKYGINYLDLTKMAISADALLLIDEKTAKEAKIACFSLVDKKIKVGARNPGDLKTAEVLNDLKERGYITELYIISSSSLEWAWKAYGDINPASYAKAGSLEIESAEIKKIIEDLSDLTAVKKAVEEILSQRKSYKISRFLETVLAGAMAVKASDIHIEPEENYMRIRYRLDGVLADLVSFDDKEMGALLLSRIKLLSGLKLNIKKDSQDGRFTVKIDASDIEIRTSVLPGAYGEAVVMRILNPESISVSLESLGIPEKLLKVIIAEINRPDGLILTTGPTGSGKTTTLYAFLKRVHNAETKIITIEDPIEYHLPGIVQTQVNDKGYNFSDGLRSAVRQDPDIIMVGEIRDNETASIAIDAAQTGHLVFSTLHTNNAAGTFPRLLDLGINPSVLSSAIHLALAQRLVRKLCPECREKVALDEQAKNRIERILSNLPQDAIKPDTGYIWKSKGCKACNELGYKGRIGVYEGIMMDSAVYKAVRENSGEEAVALSAKPQGLLTMTEDGTIKALQGITSMEELERVLDLPR